MNVDACHGMLVDICCKSSLFGQNNTLISVTFNAILGIIRVLADILGSVCNPEKWNIF